MSRSQTGRTGPADFSAPVHQSRWRLVVMAVIGSVVGVAAGVWGSWSFAPVVGWAAASVTYLVRVWLVIGTMDAATTAAHAQREDPGRHVSHALLVAGALASFAGVGLLLTEASGTQGGRRAEIVAAALASVVLSWVLIQTVYTLRYAYLFYRDGAGVDFNQDEAPRYADFAYLAFTLGMTYQVSDTDLKTRTVRATALRQGLLSYLLGAVVLATTINLVSSLAQ